MRSVAVAFVVLLYVLHQDFGLFAWPAHVEASALLMIVVSLATKGFAKPGEDTLKRYFDH